MSNFKDLLIWQKGMEIVDLTFKLAKLLPQEELFTIRPQIIRSAVSIPSNISEGAGRGTNKQFHRFLEIALASAFELETQILIIERNIPLEGFDITPLLTEINEVEKMIASFIKKVESKN